MARGDAERGQLRALVDALSLDDKPRIEAIQRARWVLAAAWEMEKREMEKR